MAPSYDPGPRRRPSPAQDEPAPIEALISPAPDGSDEATDAAPSGGAPHDVAAGETIDASAADAPATRVPPVAAALVVLAIIAVLVGIMRKRRR